MQSWSSKGALELLQHTLQYWSHYEREVYDDAGGPGAGASLEG